MRCPKEIKSKYPRRSHVKYRNGSREILEVADAVFVDDHYDEREYWKGFELVEWKDGTRELWFCYWLEKEEQKVGYGGI